MPTARGLTAAARAALPATVPHADAAFNVARAALLVYAMTTDPQLLMVATADRLHQGYRAAAMPETAELVARLRAAGVPAVVSGAGPSVLALLSNNGAEVGAGQTGAGHGDPGQTGAGHADPGQISTWQGGPDALTAGAFDLSQGWCARSLDISRTGARILRRRHAEGDPVAAGLPS